MTRLISLAACAFMLAVIVTSANEPQQACAVSVKFTLHTSTGPVVIDNACLSAPATYTNGVLTIEVVDFGDGIFRDGFDTPPVGTGAEQ